MSNSLIGWAVHLFWQRRWPQGHCAQGLISQAGSSTQVCGMQPPFADSPTDGIAWGILCLLCRGSALLICHVFHFSLYHNFHCSLIILHSVSHFFIFFLIFLFGAFFSQFRCNSLMGCYCNKSRSCFWIEMSSYIKVIIVVEFLSTLYPSYWF